MTINSIATNMFSNYSNYSSNQTSNYSSVASAVSSSDQTQKTDGPPPPPPGGGQGQGPNVDTDGDDAWSSSELEEYASYSSGTLGIELDTDSIMSTYDTDGDGTISSEEQVSLAENNAFNLPSPNDMSRQMTGFSQLGYQMTTEGSSVSSISSSSNSAQAFEQLLMAYNQDSSTSIEDLLSTFTSNV